MAANHLWQAGLSQQELMILALPLGADIPFFLFGETAFAEGIGEALQAVRGPDCWYVVLEPGVLAVEVSDVAFGPGLSPPVAAAVPELVREVMREVATDVPGR